METNTQHRPLSSVYTAPGIPHLYDKYDATIFQQTKKATGTVEAMRIIAITVSESFNVPIDLIKSKTRKREVVEPRHVMFFFQYLYTKASLTGIGSACAGRDHTTVIHAIKTVRDQMIVDVEYAKKLRNINNMLELKISKAYNSGRQSFETVYHECRTHFKKEAAV